MIFCKTLPVCSAEKVSVEKAARTESHNNVGSHGSSFRRNELGMVPGTADAGKLVRLFNSVVGSFPGNNHVMYVAFAQAGAADADEARSVLKFRDRLGAAVAHSGAKPAHQLIDHLRQRAPIRNASFNPFRHQFVQAVAVAVSIANGHGVRGRVFHGLAITLTRSRGHGGERAHTAIGLEGPSLIQNSFARTLFRSREQ